MYKDSRKLEEYKYDGTFYTVTESNSPDGDLLADSTTTTTILLETKCDVQKSDDLTSSSTLVSYYNIYFPFKGDIPVVNMCKFKATVEDVFLDGYIYGLAPTQMGGCSARLKVQGQ